MSFETIQSGRLPEELQENIPVGKTIIVGLGGTGKEVLLRLRRLIVERFGSLEALPCIVFFHLDTDKTTNALQQYDRSSKDDPLYDKIKFQPSERVNLLIEGGISKYLGSNINAYPQIKEWFQTKGKIADLGDLNEGAGQIRMASRLGFYHNYDDIEAGLSMVERRLGSEKVPDTISKLGFSFDPKILNIIVVSSFAGGTGSGTFLDMGFLLKTMFPDSTRMGIFFLPSFFSGYPGAGRMKANGYAALKELNHYSFGNSFTGNWSGREGQAIIPPPFDYTYLMDGKNDGDATIGSSQEEFSMYQMVAETVFQDFALGEFAGMKRAIRINLKNFIDNAYVHNYWESGSGITVQGGRGSIKGDSYTTRFCSFGLSTIYFPVERIHQACACRLAKNIMELWQQNVVGDPREVLFCSFLTKSAIQFAQGKYRCQDGDVVDRKDIEDALLIYNKDSGQSFPSYLWDKCLNILGDIEAADNGQKAAELDEGRRQWDALMAKADSEDADDWGQEVRRIQNNADAYLIQVKQGIKDNASELANNPRYGISYALSLLRELNKLLQNENFSYRPYFEESIKYWNERSQDCLFDLDQLQHEISSHEQRFLFRTADLERDMEMLVPKDQRGEGVLYNYFIAQVMKQAAKRGKLICEEIDRFLGEDSASGKGLLAEYHQLTSGFDNLKERLNNKETYFSTPESHATLRSLYQKGDVEQWYNNWMGEPKEHRNNLKQVSDKLLNQIFGVESVTQALRHIQEHPIETIDDQVVETCRIHFAKQEKQPSVLEILMNDSRCSKREREHLIETAYRRAKVWLKKTQKVDQVQYRVSKDQKPCIIGIDESDNVRATKFKDLVTSKMGSGDPPVQFKNIGASKKASIVFYNELGGATAFYPSSVTGVGGLRQSYNEFCRNPKDVSPDNEEDVHFDKNRFQFADIIPKTSEEAQKYSDSIRAFVLARMLGVFKVDEIKADDQIAVINRYSYEQEIAFDINEVDLGDEFASVDILYHDPNSEYESHRKLIYDQVEKVVDELRRRRLLAVYLLLIEFYRTHVYPPKTDIGAAGIQLKRFSPYYAALDYELKRVDDELIGDNESERRKLQTAFEKLRGKKTGSQKLTYAEYADRLKPYTKKAGKFEVTTRGAIGIKRDFWDVLVLDQKILFPEIEDDNEPEYQAPPDIPEPVTSANPQEPKRACPECDKLIDARAIYCIHCRKEVAAPTVCQHCGETVPDDLKVCWNCGQEAREREKKIKCSRCFSFEGYEKEFPCPECGWNPLETEPEEEPASKPDEPHEHRQRENGFEENEKQRPDDDKQHDEQENIGKKEQPNLNQMQCPHCDEMVEKKDRCSVCGEFI